MCLSSRLEGRDPVLVIPANHLRHSSEGWNPVSNKHTGSRVFARDDNVAAGMTKNWTPASAGVTAHFMEIRLMVTFPPMNTLSIIGAGNLGASIIGGLIASGIAPSDIWATNAIPEPLEQLKSKYGVNTTQDNLEATEHSDVIILSLKPDVMPSVAQTLKDQDKLFISTAAGVTLNSLNTWLGDKTRIVRCMPNTPAMIREAAIGLSANQNVTDEDKQTVEKIMSAIGKWVWCDSDEQMDAVTALSGSGPAYFFYFIEILQQAGEELGLSADISKTLAQQTAYGAAKLVHDTQADVVELRRQVTSPNGTTEKALQSMEDSNVRDSLKKAVRAAFDRSNEMGSSL